MPREGRRRREKKSDSTSEQGADDAASSKMGADDPAETEVAAGRSQGGNEKDDERGDEDRDGEKGGGVRGKSDPKKPSASDEEDEEDEEGDDEGGEEEQEERDEEEERPKESVNQSRGSGRTAKLKSGDFVLPQVDAADLANENDDVSLTVLGGDAADDENALAQARAESSIYFESGSDRIFQRKRQGGKDEKGASRVDARSEKDEELLKHFLDLVASLIASSFIFCQGLLGGISLMMLYFSANQTDRELLRSYSPIAADTQKAFMFLSSFSMIGALDKYSKDHMAAWVARGGVQRGFDCALMAVYFACFVSTLVCTPLDDVMYSSHLRSPEYYKWDVGADFQEQFASWKVAHLLRCLCGLLGWAASSWETRNYLNNAPNKALHDIYEHVYGTRVPL
mmetsp:Transcript_37685/g.60786  ORF Transcript_37685/g.60786 Transcript_37685/m.60786 type:complete len:397 (-) Transcript_37685:95-1285(-)|eukprot:CAMPEP_0179409924 /NCGR_PEP_ID=MMETSP0799-20121207/2986_1 /TAXON_ID=46947 /ORGANISM="Geminigera cryophila, Strain CCMP2564" /LENGTH=396 /DNA_ID=CAMNT_0021181685 /DNA_START=113 /DNA_END=1303 /DNA_ORIENTATION=+